MQPPSFEQFQQLAMHGNVIPIARAMFADLLTPVSAFLKLCHHREDGFLLESVEKGEQLGRYSFLGVRPPLTVTASGDTITLGAAGATVLEESR